MLQLVHFKLAEFDCKCGCGRDVMHPEFLSMLDKARDAAGIPFGINSGCRCVEHNAAEGGVGGSSHVDGWAADIACQDDRTRLQILSALYDAGFRRFGIGATFIHADCDPNKHAAIWLYR